MPTAITESARRPATGSVTVRPSTRGSTKMLNEKIVQNMTANAEAAFRAAQAIATAKSLPEIAKLQSEFVQKFAAQATEQTKDFFDLSTRICASARVSDPTTQRSAPI